MISIHNLDLLRYKKYHCLYVKIYKQLNRTRRRNVFKLSKFNFRIVVFIAHIFLNCLRKEKLNALVGGG